jgi:hypothetical protein
VRFVQEKARFRIFTLNRVLAPYRHQEFHTANVISVLAFDDMFRALEQVIHCEWLAGRRSVGK